MTNECDEETIGRWVAICRAALDDCARQLRPVFAQQSEQDHETNFVLAQLSTSCLLTSDSAIALIEDLRTWDADILVRSVLEGTCKFAFLCAHDDALRKERIREYWHVLPDIKRLRRHQRVSVLLRLSPTEADSRVFRDLLLSEDEVEGLYRAYPKSLRHSLEQRWSFTSLVSELSTSDLPGADALVVMLHTYGMSSHIAHQDGDGVGMVWERHTRGEERIRAIEMAHGARQLSDLFYMGFYRGVVALHSRQLDIKPVLSLHDKYLAFFGELHQAYQAWLALEYGQARA